MKKMWKKLFSGSNIAEVGEKSSRKSSTMHNRVSVSNLKNKVKINKSNPSQSNDLSSRSSVSKVAEERDNSSRIERPRPDSIAASLHAAVSEGNVELVEKWLSQGADSETIDENGLTPFLKAVKMGNVQLVNLLVQKNKFQTDADGNSALHIAVKEEFLRIVEILVAHDPLVNVPNKVGDLPLHVAVSKECFSIVKLLLENNAVLDIEDSQKRTPLFIALKLENIPLIQLLLKYGAHKNDQCIITCLPSIRNPKIKTLFRFLDGNDKTTSFVNDDDSQNSEQCVLPPILNSPRSWNVLHPKQNDECQYTGDITNLLLQKRRRKTNKFRNKGTEKSDKNSSSRIADINESDSLAIDGESSIEDCKKALTELSLQILRNENLDVLDKSDGAKKSPEIPSIVTADSFLSNEIKSLKNPETKYDQNQDLHKNAQSSVKFTEEYSSSSDEEPLMWENSHDGGYFTEWSRSSKLSESNEIENRSKSSSSDEELDDFHHNTVYSVMLNSLKQMTHDNKDLETEGAILRESVEKLKYDLANCREIANTERINSSSLISHLENVDKKYLKAVENVGTSQLYTSNLEKEISHLKRTYNESCKVNRFLAKELRKTLDDIALLKSMKCRTCESSNIKINVLQAEITEWKSKYNNLAQHCAERDSFSYYHQVEAKNSTEPEYDKADDIMKDKLLFEISKLTSIVKDKEVKEEQLKNQVYELREEIRKSKNEKRNMLIRKTFHDKCSPTSRNTEALSLESTEKNCSLKLR